MDKYIQNNYIVYHLHDDTSNANGYMDSCTNYYDYIKLAKKCKMKAIAFSNHGGIYDWVKKKQACDKAGIKYIHGVELYLCHKLEDNNRGWHIGLYAKNLDGVKELNTLMSQSTSKGKNADNTDRHVYYNPRISFEELFNTSDNIIVTTACLASALWKLGSESAITEDGDTTQYDKNLKLRTSLLEWLSKNKHRCFLEVQYHNCDHQKKFNKMLYEWSKQYKIPLIAGTDTHSSTSYKAECRKILQKSKDSYYGEEDEFDLTWKTYNELIECLKNQGVLEEDVCMKAIHNTNVLADMVEDFELDRTFKYPELYGNTANEQLKALISTKLQEKLDRKEIDVNRIDEYKKAIQEEFEALSKQGMESFMIFMSELMTWCRENDIHSSPCRGSVGGSTIAYITDITDVNPLIWNTVFSRFCNAERISLADIDQDFAPKDRLKVYQYIIDRFGNKNVSYILTLGTIQDRGSIDVLAKGLDYTDLDQVKKIKNTFDESFNKYAKTINECFGDLTEIEGTTSSSPTFDDHDIYIKRISSKKIIEQLNECKSTWDKLREDNKDLFYYFDGIKGTIVSKGNHPAGMIGSPITLYDNLGVFYKKGDENFPVSFCSMKAVDFLNYVKFDILGLKTVGIIQDAFRLANKEWLYAYQMDWNDKKVWADMVRCNSGIFQFEGLYAHDLLKTIVSSMNNKNISTTINHMSMVNAALRPSGKSYRDELVSGEIHKNPSKEIDSLLESNNGYLIFQEDTIKFLTDICGFSGSMADTTRRAIGKKDVELLNEQLPKILEGYCSNSSSSREEAEKEAKQFVQIISDSSDYQFGYNHSTGYSMVGYMAAYARTYFPLEFITSYFNWCENDDDYENGMKMIKEYKIKLKNPMFRYSKGEYFFDKETNSTYKGIGSMKGFSVSVGDELYSLRDNKYQTFVDLLHDIKCKTSVGNSIITKLIKIGFFSEFGSVKYLLSIMDIVSNLYDKYIGNKSIKKDSCVKLGIGHIDMSKYASDILKSGKVGASWTGIDYDRLINDLAKNVPSSEYDIETLIEFQLEILGYISYTNKNLDKKYCRVISVDGEKTRKVQLYCYKNGVTATVKFQNKDFKRNPFEKGMNLYTRSMKKDFKAVPEEKDEDGNVTKWGKDTSTIEWWCSEYSVVGSIDEIID